ncbi:MAG: CHRD domain-containing protein [Cellvibrionaceae bacterium]|nr:CHRD domain-containing protein [Cellvibrionaceae bacterium]
MSGAQEVPATNTAFKGTALLEIDESTFQMRASVDVSAVADVQNIHIHRGGAGVNGDVLVGLSRGNLGFGLEGGTWSLAPESITQGQIDAVKAGNWYFNVHTSRYASGEVRGQILTDNYTLLAFSLAGIQQVPGVETAAKGYGYGWVNRDTSALQIRVITENIEDILAAHIHDGRVGENGGINIALESVSGEPGVWSTPANTTINAAALDTLLSGGYYVNVHTSQNPTGEIRGQVVSEDFAVAAFKLSGAQEFPLVDSAASGNGYALIDKARNVMELTVLTEGVDDATIAHIHGQNVGRNGGVLTALQQDDDDPSIWRLAPDTVLQPSVIDQLLAGGHYVNVHTPANASGEIRGQIITDNFVLATFDLSGSQEVPALQTVASGNAYALMDENTYGVQLTVDTDNIDVTVAHIHSNRIGANGGVVVALQADLDPDLQGVWRLEDNTVLQPSDFESLLSAGAYVNIHSEANPSGEIRGQIITDNLTLFAFNLSGDQEAPAVDTNASGDGYALVDQFTQGIELTVKTQNLENATVGHIHGERIGSNGGVRLALEQDQTDTSLWRAPDNSVLPDEVYQELLSAGAYVNVHSQANPSGEIRGQIIGDNLVLATFKLAGDQEVPVIETNASGDGYALMDTQNLGLELRVLTDNLDAATVAHIHSARVGNNGGILLALEQDLADPRIWFAPAGTQLSQEDFDGLVSGGNYVNVHSEANAAGEIRGQILTRNFVLTTFQLSGDQEVPVVATEASGDGYAVMDSLSLALELTVITSNLVDPSVAHIHSARVGNNGGILLALVQDDADATIWTAPGGTQLGEDEFAAMVSGGNYVNVHSDANPAGEIRGQILTDNFILSTFELAGDQEAPPVATEASGNGYVLMDTATLGLELTVVTNNLEQASVGHIHSARIGVNGGIFLALEQSEEEESVWSLPEATPLAQADFDDLLAGAKYVNIHSQANPAGEIRGQILTDNFSLSTFVLSGGQEVPAVVSEASGNGYVLLNSTDLSVEMRVITRDLDDATAAHIHSAVAGENGDILFFLGRDEEVDPNFWTSSVDALLAEEAFAAMLAGGNYVNVHSQTNPSGEIRGQFFAESLQLSSAPAFDIPRVAAADSEAIFPAFSWSTGLGSELALLEFVAP